jgi:hypothetical protein
MDILGNYHCTEKNCDAVTGPHFSAKDYHPSEHPMLLIVFVNSPGCPVPLCGSMSGIVILWKNA